MIAAARRPERRFQRITRVLLAAPLAVLFGYAASAQPHEAIRLNQVGFYPNGPKTAVIVEAPDNVFYVVDAQGADTVYSGTLGDAATWEHSGERVRIADFTPLTAVGRYRVLVPAMGLSHAFDVRPSVHERLARGAIKGFYFQRASTTLPAEYAGKWSRAAGHPDDAVLIHPSAATDDRPDGSTIGAPKGWYDAGDYNKYIVNSGITMGTLLSLYEAFPEYASALRLDIPEQHNGIPDLLDEVLWNLRWMLAMQDPSDGGVYTKLTTAHFEDAVMPEAARSQRYVVQKSTPAALDFAAVSAQAARILRDFEEELPGLADSCETAALQAWAWARRHPAVMYQQWRMNEHFEPDIMTGGYGDRSVADEFLWAASELYTTTGVDTFFTAVGVFPSEDLALPAWPRVTALAYYTLLRGDRQPSAAVASHLPRVRELILTLADSLVADGERSAYRVPMGSGERDFVWGSNSVAANQGIALLQAHALTGDEKYLEHAMASLDYLLGRNATGYSFVTGYGSRTPTAPHHRPSEADGVSEPVPGLLVGGPNPGMQDGCTYPATEPARAYVDDYCSYASNEIAINWNAPFAYLVAAIEALQQAGSVAGTTDD